jgi:hypothetical protein
MGSDKSQRISRQMGLSGRVDIYYAFLLYASQFLEKDGIAGYITSNKFMTTKAGRSVREYLLSNTCIKKITDFGDTKLFDASVLPCTIVFERGVTCPENVDFTSVYQSSETSVSIKSGSIFEAIDKPGSYLLTDGRTFEVNRGALKAENSWTVSTPENCFWLSHIKQHTYCKFSDIGKIRVGIKTTADNVFISSSECNKDNALELLQPLVTHRNAGQIVSNKNPRWSVLYPYDMTSDNRICLNLDNYPLSKKYLEEKRTQLESREYIRDAGRLWYEIWVPQKPSRWKKRKIVFRDISETPQFWLDDDSIVNGDCYWIDIKDDLSDELLYLALAVANSHFIKKYYDIRFNNKLYSGKRRYMSRYVEEFPIPDPNNKHSIRAIELVNQIIKNGDPDKNIMKEISDCVDMAFI